MQSWWVRYPKEYDREIAALDELAHLGYKWVIDEAAKSDGRLVINLERSGSGTDGVKLTALYPDSYPYFQPQVVLHGEVLKRHHHPFGRNLCLLEREGEDWQPGRDTLARLIQDQLPKVTKIAGGGMSSEDVAINEDHVGEAVSSFLPYFPNCTLIVPDKTPPSNVVYGCLSILARSEPVGWDREYPFVNGVVQKILDPAQMTLAQFPCELTGCSNRLPGFWMRLDAPPELNEETAQNLVHLLRTKVREFDKAVKTGRRNSVIVAGFVYRDEVNWGTSSDDWIFVVVQITTEAKRSRPVSFNMSFVRANWGGEDAILRRAPSLRSMRNRRVLVFGLGSLGSPVVLHLARAGVGHLHLMDSDHLQVGNTVRWALGWKYAGFQKTSALKMHLAAEYPLTSVTSTDLRLGVPRDVAAAGPDDYSTLRAAVEKTDLVIDASASQRVSHFLADLTSELRKPFVWLTATPGTAGGVVGRIVPGKTVGCWHCFQRGLADGTIRQPADTGAKNIQPPGCSQATFVGAGIDSDEIALMASRLAVSILAHGEPDGFPEFAWNVAVVDLKRNGGSIAPDWTVYPLDRNDTCQACNPG